MVRKCIPIPALVMFAVLLQSAAAQDDPEDDRPAAPRSLPAASRWGSGMADMTPASMFLMSLGSGTAVNPAAFQMPMLMRHYGNWNTMLMGLGFLSDIQQSGPRGGDKLYSTNWFMGAAEHRLGANGAFQAELMLSLEPATVTDRRYPLLFQTGETAYGAPLTDAQHPHNFIMALGFHYVRRLAPDTMLDLYVAPVGDPALGPLAFPHRASALEFPQAPISHHWQDSTHIADDVVTTGLQYHKVKLEASGFHGAEPGENRWIIQQGAIDSWSGRVWFLPSQYWAAQVSAGRIAHPEALEAGDQTRVTASVAYTRPLAGGNWSSTFSWGRIHNTATQRGGNSFLVETVVPVRRRSFVSGRVELVDKDDLFAGDPVLQQHLVLQQQELYGSTFRVGAYTAGYTRVIGQHGAVETGIGANVTVYSLPYSLQPYYGGHPIGGNIFLRFGLRRAGS